MIRVKTLRAHYYGRDVKEPGEVYEGVEPAIYQLISSGKAEQTAEHLGAARPAPAPRPAAKPKPKASPGKDDPADPDGDD